MSWMWWTKIKKKEEAIKTADETKCLDESLVSSFYTGRLTSWSKRRWTLWQKVLSTSRRRKGGRQGCQDNFRLFFVVIGILGL